MDGNKTVRAIKAWWKRLWCQHVWQSIAMHRDTPEDEWLVGMVCGRCGKIDYSDRRKSFI